MVDEIPEHNKIIKAFPNTNLPIYYINGEPKRFFFKYWEINLTFPIIVVILTLLGVIIFFFINFPFILSIKVRIFCTLCFLFSLVMFLWSYFAAVLMDPGFLPYDWFATQRTKYSYQEQLEGLAINFNQIGYAESHQRPVGSCFSRTFGRFVLRPDHVCGWVANWIGKRNHKQFILLLFWGGIFSLLLCIFRFLPMLYIKEYPSNIEFYANLTFVFECLFALGLNSGWISQLVELCANQTQLQRMKKLRDPSFIIPKTSKIDGLRQVFGYDILIFWFIPTPAFGDVIPFELEEPIQNKRFQRFIVHDIPILDDDDVL